MVRYWVETLGCPKNQVDSDKLAGTLAAQGMAPADEPGTADVVVVNTCAFIEAARQESVDTILELADRRRPGARLIVTGCLAERYGDDLAGALPEVDRVARFGESLLGDAGAEPARPGGSARPGALAGPVGAPAGARAGAVGATPGASAPVALGPTRLPAAVRDFDLLTLPRPPVRAPWAYLKVAEGCDRACGFCAIPSFRGAQRSREPDDLLREVDALGAREVVLVAQDLASYGRDLGRPGSIVTLVEALAARVDRVRLLYLYPSQLTDRLVDAIAATGCPYFDLSLQHASGPHLRRMRRWGDGDRFARRVERIRSAHPEAAFRSSFIVGYPGETEEDHDRLLGFLEEVQLDWAGFFPYSREEGTLAAGLPDQVPAGLVAERLAEVTERQDAITAAARSRLVGSRARVLVDRPGEARSHREAPEIDGVVRVPAGLAAGEWAEVTIVGAEGPDVDAVPASAVAEALSAVRAG